ncbi:TPA: DUF2142 domain-containing protein [Streptococcus suis]|uniref:DUF2142 domain-containing protein n=1 Tax=Streptococcus parasuis TaxID=1501662 RepID=A0A4V2HC59_9STRE|nr:MULTISPECIES: DUF2142 domain-containing protein [Streptococcus]NQM93041.1 DUF2142 domain-containing protein [Streptococcus suis]NQO40305.1 DUF2142 domain-containing protein [Streptococcus suis]NQP22499.1 DUF2142 domain-containing protein [Streptococcus suis]NQP24466.1 DUF2142 domain-containing protein [Streptococcus suis]TAA11757.1 DUF2142 domain-containing protein [Streptococcus parasuis]
MKIEKIFLYLAICMIGISVFFMPATEVPDEVKHADIAWHILYPDSDHIMDWEAKNDIINNPQPADADVNWSLFQQFFVEKIDTEQISSRFNFELKSISYLPQFIGMYIGKLIYPSLGVILTFGRLVNAAVYIIAIFYFIKYIRSGKEVLLFVSLLPMMIQQAGSLSYDVLNHVAVAGFFTFIINLLDRRTFGMKHLLQLLAIAILLAVVKLNNIFLLAVLAFVNFEYIDRLTLLNPFLKWFQKHRLVVLSLLSFLVAVVAGVYIHQTVGVKQFVAMMFNTLMNNNLNGALNTFLTTGIFGYFGWLTIPLPLWVVFFDIFVLTLLLFVDKSFELPKSEAIVLGMVFPVQVAIIIAIMYFLWTPQILGENASISVGTQGRYFTPFLLYLYPLCAGWKKNINIDIVEKTKVNLIVGTLAFNFIVYLILIGVYYWF